MAERWYGGWDSGINSEAPSAATTKPPSCSGVEVSKLTPCQPISYASQQNFYAQQQFVAPLPSQDVFFLILSNIFIFLFC